MPSNKQFVCKITKDCLIEQNQQTTFLQYHLLQMLNIADDYNGKGTWYAVLQIVLTNYQYPQCNHIWGRQIKIYN